MRFVTLFQKKKKHIAVDFLRIHLEKKTGSDGHSIPFRATNF